MFPWDVGLCREVRFKDEILLPNIRWEFILGLSIDWITVFSPLSVVFLFDIPGVDWYILFKKKNIEGL